MIRRFEELPVNTKLSLETVEYYGWIMRFSRAGVRKINSFNPLNKSTIDTDKKIAYCKNQYAQHQLPVIFSLHRMYFVL